MTRSQRHKFAQQYVDSSGKSPLAITPFIGSLLPPTGANATTINLTVLGDGFLPTDKIVFRGTNYPLIAYSANSITASVPLGAAGSIPVTVKRGDNSKTSNAVNFTVT